MSIDSPMQPQFNLWRVPWITLERSSGPSEVVSLEAALINSHRYLAIFDSSPLVVVGVYRLLIAVLQAALHPRGPDDLLRLYRSGQIPAQAIMEFGERYAHRFDLFSSEYPFMQSADLPICPSKDGNVKTVGYLVPEWPAGTGVIHYRHLTDRDHCLCPVCAALCLVTIPCFATVAGRGFNPSINGVPPIYVIPSGRSLFESLVFGLCLPDYQPEAASKRVDQPWWERPPVVSKAAEAIEVGYLHSLTFPARRIRLHPQPFTKSCARCGTHHDWEARTMVFEMGESRSKEAAFWKDPFAAYRLTDPKKPPTPVRPVEGKALWREYSTLFLNQTQTEKMGYLSIRPRILDQIAELSLLENVGEIALRCIGLRTDMKAKVFEWLDAEFVVPTSLLDDPFAAITIRRAVRFAEEVERIIIQVFRSQFGGPGKDAKRYFDLRNRMAAAYWEDLSSVFPELVLGLSRGESGSALNRWADTVFRRAIDAFRQSVEATGDSAEQLRKRVKGEQTCRIRLAAHRSKYLVEEGVKND